MMIIWVNMRSVLHNSLLMCGVWWWMHGREGLLSCLSVLQTPKMAFYLPNTKAMFIMLIYDEKGLQSAANNHITRKNKTCSFCHFFSLRRRRQSKIIIGSLSSCFTIYSWSQTIATMEGFFKFLGKRKESKRYKCLDVLFWQFKHIKLIFIYVGLRGANAKSRVELSQDTSLHCRVVLRTNDEVFCCRF